MSSNLLINSTLHTVFHPEFSILIHGYTEMLDCSAEALLGTMWSFSFSFMSVGFSLLWREREGRVSLATISAQTVICLMSLCSPSNPVSLKDSLVQVNGK